MGGARKAADQPETLAVSARNVALAVALSLTLTGAPALAARKTPAPAAATSQSAGQSTGQAAGQPATSRAAQPAGQNDPRRTPVVRVVELAGPAVVSIISARGGPSPFAEERPQPPADAWNEMSRESSPPRQKASRNLGSGVIIDGAKGYVLTNAHVITGGTRIFARLQDGRVYTAALLGADQDMDLAVLRLEMPKGAEPLPQARMGDSDGLMIGEPVVAIGNPFGLANTVTTGVVSAVGRSVEVNQHTITGLIQTDAAINPGNSGGPLLNILGDVVGINAAVYARGGGLGFAIPIAKARRVLDELIATGRVAHIWLGLLGEDMRSSGRERPRPRGASWASGTCTWWKATPNDSTWDRRSGWLLMTSGISAGISPRPTRHKRSISAWSNRETRITMRFLRLAGTSRHCILYSPATSRSNSLSRSPRQFSRPER